MGTDVETQVDSDKKRADRAIARMTALREKLETELQACGSVHADLYAYAATGKPDDIPGRMMRAEAIRTVLAEIPAIMAQLKREQVDAVQDRNAALAAAKRATAKKTYAERLQAFDAGYNELANSRDRDALHEAADELVRIASEAATLPDLRHHFQVRWANRHRAHELARL